MFPTVEHGLIAADAYRAAIAGGDLPIEPG
jgi:hypothetical protein